MPFIRAANIGIAFRLSFSRICTLREWLWTHVTGQAEKRRQQVHWALEDISVEVEPGQILGVIGRNGCGKTTLLRVMAGILQPDRGRIEVQGRVTSLLGLGTGFNNTMSGRMNIYLSGLLLGMSYDELRHKVPDIVEFAELGDYIDVPVKYYSSGMISRLGFAIATAMEPDILLIDEALSAGDLAFRDKSERRMGELRRRARLQVIVSHDLNFIEEHCHRVLFMDRGRVLFLGEPREAVKRYRDFCAAASSTLVASPMDGSGSS